MLFTTDIDIAVLPPLPMPPLIADAMPLSSAVYDEYCLILIAAATLLMLRARCYADAADTPDAYCRYC